MLKSLSVCSNIDLHACSIYFSWFIANTASVMVGFILKLVYRVYYMFYLVLLHYRAHGKAKHFVVYLFSNRERQVAVLPVCFLFVRRYRVVDKRLYAVIQQVFLQFIAP